MIKKYIKPETKTYEIELHLLDQTSLTKDPDDIVDDNDDVLSRGFGFFEEEDEE